MYSLPYVEETAHCVAHLAATHVPPPRRHAATPPRPHLHPHTPLPPKGPPSQEILTLEIKKALNDGVEVLCLDGGVVGAVSVAVC